MKSSWNLDQSPLENFKHLNEDSPADNLPRAAENFDDIDDEGKNFDSHLQIISPKSKY